MSETNEKYLEGQTVKGIVTGVTSNAIYLEIEEGVKAVIYANDLLEMPKDGKLFNEYSEGAEFSAQVKSVGMDKKDANTILLTLSTKLQAEAEAREAKEKALREKIAAFKEIKDNDEIITAKVVRTVKNGVELTYNHTRLFLSYKNALLSEDAFKKMKGQDIDVIVIYVSEEYHQVAVSQIAAVKKQKRLEKEAAYNALEVGQVITGEVVSLLDFGAIVKFNNVSGLLHISELDHFQVKDINKVLKVGQTITAKIIKINGDKIGLSVRALTKHPWELLKEQYHVGDVFDGLVKKIIPAGLIIELTSEYSGLMPKTEYSWFVNEKYDNVVTEGSKITLKVVSIDDQKHRVSLSHRETLENTWKDIKLKKGQVIEVKVLSTNEKGAQVAYLNVTGFLPVSEVSSVKRVNNVAELFPVDTVLNVMVQDCDPSRAKLVVSAKALEVAKERETFDNYMKQQEKELENSTSTLGDLFAKLNEK